MNRTEMIDFAEFVSKIVRSGGTSADAVRLVQAARKIARANEAECNGQLSGRGSKIASRAADEARFIAQKLGATVKIGGDPRGFAVKLVWSTGPNAGVYNTWGGREDGWGVPA